jgi:hypothetical protein
MVYPSVPTGSRMLRQLHTGQVDGPMIQADLGKVSYACFGAVVPDCQSIANNVFFRHTQTRC